MSNARLINRMRLALDDYEQSEMSASDVERTVESHIRALEQIRTAEEHEAYRLCARLVEADLARSPGEYEGQRLEFEGDEPVADVLADFRAFLSRLPE